MGQSLTAGRIVLAILAATAAGTVAGAALGDDAGLGQDRDGLAVVSHAESTACGAASATTTANVDATVARRIYDGELRGTTVSADAAHVTGSGPLLSALASSNLPAVYAAVHRIVYTPRWHIVRLRIVRAGHVVADVGGPYVIAPVSGLLRSKGRIVGSYVMSVQDDVGYVKLVSRFIGVPIDIYRRRSFLMGTLRPAPPSGIRTADRVTVGGRPYHADVFDAHAFPTGSLRVALLIPRPANSVAAGTCQAVRLAAWGSIAKHIAGRFATLPNHYQDLTDILRSATGGLAFVTSGSRHLAGGVGRAIIPRTGIVKYRGRSWSVFSWEPDPPARIYLLTPPR